MEEGHDPEHLEQHQILCGALNLNETCPQLQYDKPIHLLFVVIKIISFIIGVFSSSFVILTVAILKALHTPFEYVLGVRAGIDFLTCVFVIIPEVDPSLVIRCWIFQSRSSCIYYSHTTLIFEMLSLGFLTYLCCDRSIRINCSKFYHLKVNKNNTMITIFVVVFAHINMMLASADFVINEEITCFSSDTLAGLLRLYTVVHLAFWIIICIGLCIQIHLLSLKDKRKGFGEIEKITMICALVMQFSVLHLPTVVHRFIFGGKFCSLTLDYTLIKMIRELSPVTNSSVIAFTRPDYKDAFIIFLNKNPMHWPKEFKSRNKDFLFEQSEKEKIREGRIQLKEEKEQQQDSGDKVKKHKKREHKSHSIEEQKLTPLKESESIADKKSPVYTPTSSNISLSQSPIVPRTPFQSPKHSQPVAVTQKPINIIDSDSDSSSYSEDTSSSD